MWKSLSFRSYSTIKHTHTHKVFNKLFKNKIDIKPEEFQSDDLRTEMALYMINNRSRYHRNHPELLYELQQHHTTQTKKLKKFKKKIDDDFKNIKPSDCNMLNSLFLLGIDQKTDELLFNHRRQIRKVDEVKHQNPEFWSFKIPEE